MERIFPRNIKCLLEIEFFDRKIKDENHDFLLRFSDVKSAHFDIHLQINC